MAIGGSNNGGIHRCVATAVGMELLWGPPALFFNAVVDAAMLWALRSSSRTVTGADTGFDLERDRAKMSGHGPHLQRLLRLTASPC